MKENENEKVARTLAWLVEPQQYRADTLHCFAFRRGTDSLEGCLLALGNMVAGFPFELGGVRMNNSEAAYIAGMFSDGSEACRALQEKCRENTNGLMCKRAVRRPNRHLARKDWEEFNIEWMLYVVWCKVTGSAAFRRLLSPLPDDAVIIEDSTFQSSPTATVWGTRNAALRQLTNETKKQMARQPGLTRAEVKRRIDALRLGAWRTEGVWEGKNIMGKILMLCSRAMREGFTPAIDLAQLRSRHINWFGHVLQFEDLPEITA